MSGGRRFLALLGGFFLFLAGLGFLVFETLAGLLISAAALAAAYGAFQRPERAPYAPLLCIAVALGTLITLLALDASSVFFALWLFSGGLIGLAGLLQRLDRKTQIGRETA